ncbi:hypothetical protein BDQ12DRAFT_685628 [Crucibulum laeve]|uniref:Uncharacterized protein n=1 Tax=Crucibulum laeve TaxID=68775 RepID=A0A5C3LWU4_9AGAR|nr:hypothetical protein BDQ12DRAFT_685628 [Crucibulum laeve]
MYEVSRTYDAAYQPRAYRPQLSFSSRLHVLPPQRLPRAPLTHCYSPAAKLGSKRLNVSRNIAIGLVMLVCTAASPPDTYMRWWMRLHSLCGLKDSKDVWEHSGVE